MAFPCKQCMCSRVDVDQTSCKPSRETRLAYICLRKLCLCTRSLSSVQMTPKSGAHLLMLTADIVVKHAEGHGVEVGCDYAKVADMLRKKLGKNGAAVAP